MSREDELLRDLETALGRGEQAERDRAVAERERDLALDIAELVRCRFDVAQQEGYRGAALERLERLEAKRRSCWPMLSWSLLCVLLAATLLLMALRAAGAVS